jgi:CBS domain containing-hemolysin-like protein
MIPRDKMVVVNSDMTIEQFCNVARTSRFTRMPVFDVEKKQFGGVVNVFDVLSAGCERKDRLLAEHARPPLFVPEDMPIMSVLPRIRRLRQPLCLVASKDNEVVGLVTADDILGRIVGKA